MSGQKTKDKTIVFQSFSNLMDAKALQQRLAESGIESFLNDENVLGMDPIAGVELKIFEKDQDAAMKLINDLADNS